MLTSVFRGPSTRAARAGTAYASGLKQATAMVNTQTHLVATAAARSNGAVTPGQGARGHSGSSGAEGWKRAGWDLQSQSLTPELRDLLMTYGELSHATYDNLGLDRSNTNTYGKTIYEDPQMLLKYLDNNYPLDASAPAPTAPGTADKYKLPAICTVRTEAHGDLKLSPLIYALPGKLDNGQVSKKSNMSIFDNVLDFLFNQGSSILVSLVDDSNEGRPLFRTNPKTGRGKEATGAFIGYVAMTPPKSPDDEVDVALVWRGTIFKEEWESNFAEDKLSEWQKDPEVKTDIILEQSHERVARAQKKETRSRNIFTPIENLVLPTEDDTIPEPWKVGVHDGFDDLYNRPIEQPESYERLSPRQVVRLWLIKLMAEHNVTTITSTGHSLGGGLATISAFGTGKLLEEVWANCDRTGWKTQQKPKVTLVSWASPRVGNYTFKEEFNKLGIRALRIVNKGDVVPLVPGLFVEFFTWIFEHLPIPFIGKSASYDMDSWPVRGISFLYQAVTSVWASVPLVGRPPRWGYFHVGQVLELDPEKGTVPASEADRVVVKNLGIGQKHNLELYMHLLSKLGENNTYGSTLRNPLLLNKSGDLLAKDIPGTKNQEKLYPADWWRAAATAEVPARRGYVRNRQGRWVFPGAIAGVMSRASIADEPAGAAATAEVVEVGAPAKKKD